VNHIVYRRADLSYRESFRIVNRMIHKHFESYLFFFFNFLDVVTVSRVIFLGMK